MYRVLALTCLGSKDRSHHAEKISWLEHELSEASSNLKQSLVANTEYVERLARADVKWVIAKGRATELERQVAKLAAEMACMKKALLEATRTWCCMPKIQTWKQKRELWRWSRIGILTKLWSCSTRVSSRLSNMLTSSTTDRNIDVHYRPVSSTLKVKCLSIVSYRGLRWGPWRVQLNLQRSKVMKAKLNRS